MNEDRNMKSGFSDYDRLLHHLDPHAMGVKTT